MKVKVRLDSSDYECYGYYFNHIYEMDLQGDENSRLNRNDNQSSCWVNNKHFTQLSTENTDKPQLSSFQEDLVKPKRYNRGTLEVWDAWVGLDLGPFESNILKYLCRFREKGGIKDLEKAKIYLEKLIEIESNR